jgi:8-oxo-dGTP pyrophosphatase MutT (NUDIX family)
MAVSPPRLVQSAVLVPLFRRGQGEVRLLLVRRGEGGPHGGQIAFPGGRCEPGDNSPLETALREAAEEVGIDSARAEILARLPAVDTMTTGFLIHPFLARITPSPVWRCQPGEIAEVIEIDVAELNRPEIRGEDWLLVPPASEPTRVSYYRIGPHRLWGATYRIVEALLPRLVAGEWRV